MVIYCCSIDVNYQEVNYHFLLLIKSLLKSCLYIKSPTENGFLKIYTNTLFPSKRNSMMNKMVFPGEYLLLHSRYVDPSDFS